jgi:hypothetical protein
MTSDNANPGVGDSGVRQIVHHSGKNAAGLNSQDFPPSQAPGRADHFGVRQAARVCAFLARRRATAPVMIVGAPPRTISGGRP